MVSEKTEATIPAKTKYLPDSSTVKAQVPLSPDAANGTSRTDFKTVTRARMTFEEWTSLSSSIGGAVPLRNSLTCNPDSFPAPHYVVAPPTKAALLPS